MTNMASRPHGDGGEDTAVHSNADDISDVTPPGHGGLKRNEHKYIEKTVKFRFIQNSSTDQANPSQIHLHWIQIVQEEFGKEVVVMTNNNKVMPKVDTLTWTSTQHSKQFNLHQSQFNNNSNSKNVSTNRRMLQSTTNSREKAAFIVHRVRMAISLTELKSSQRVHDLLRQHNCFLTEHRWTEDVWNTTQLGFMLGLDPQYYNVTMATEKVNTELKSHFPNKTKIPQFKLAFSTPSVDYNGHKIRTKAYAIETEKQNSMELMMILKHVYRENTEFIPFQMRNKHPEAYTRILLQQTKTLSHNHVILINHMSTDALYYLSDRIRATKGVRDLVNVNHSDYPDRYKVLVHKDDFSGARRILLEQLPIWYQEEFVPEDAKSSHPDHRTPEVAPLNSDACSSGEGTYMSSSVNTAMSYASTLSDWTLSEESKQKDNSATSVNLTWAQRVKGNSTATPSTSRTNKSNATPSQITIDDELISDLASSKAEVEELRSKLLSLERDKENHQREMDHRAAQQKREMELQAAEQRLEMERQADTQRREMEAKLEEQRKQFESQTAAQQTAFENRIDSQLAAFQQRISIAAPVIPPAPPAPDYTQMFANHDRQLQMLTTMMSKMIPPDIPTTPSAMHTSSKRAAVIDLTVDNEEMYDTRAHASIPLPQRSDYPKRPDLKSTPTKFIPNTSITTPESSTHRRRHSSPSSQSDGTSMINSQMPYQRTKENNQWMLYHYCDVKSPMSYTDPRHPLHPGPEDDHDSLIDEDAHPMSPQFEPFTTRGGIFDDSQVSPNQMLDIKSQHRVPASRNATPKQFEEPHTELSDSSHSSNEGNKKRPAHATPVETVNPTSYHV